MLENEISLSENLSTISELSQSDSLIKMISEPSHMVRYSSPRRSTTELSDQNEEDSSVSRFLAHARTMSVLVVNTNESAIRELSVSDVVSK
jgi:hypothetical protein